MKKILCLLLSVTLLLLFTACSNKSNVASNTNAENEKNQTSNIEKADEIDKSAEDGLLFTTEYTIEDYVEDAIIVSKNDQLLYGVLDNNGNEVIPVKYDDIYFLNKDEYVEDKCENIYLSAQYEDIYTVFDIHGKEIIGDSNTYIGCINPKIKAVNDDSLPFFYSEADGEIIFYNEKGKEISRNSNSINTLKQQSYISNNWYIIYNKVSTGFKIYNYSGTIIEEEDLWLYNDYVINNEYYMLVASKPFAFVNGKYIVDGKYIESDSNDFRCEKIIINTEGNIRFKEVYNNPDDLVADVELLEKQEKDTVKTYYNLYESNSTWKLEDLEGNTLYDERYYDAFKNHSENDCVALKNEDNQILLISRTGKIYINYGILETNDGGNTMRMLCGDSIKTVEEIFEGRNSIIIPVSSSKSGHYDLYYFGEK